MKNGASSRLRVPPANDIPRNPDRSVIGAMAERVRNWNRWGPDDELGTLNYIGPEFLFCAPPLPITGAVGSPINPIALK